MTMMVTVTAAAERLGVSPEWARRLCGRHGIGVKVHPRLRLLSEADVRRLERAVAETPPAGNPRLGGGEWARQAVRERVRAMRARRRATIRAPESAAVG